MGTVFYIREHSILKVLKIDACLSWYYGASPSTILLCSIRLLPVSKNERSVEELPLQR
jgi:hypothetical protein